MKNKDSPFALWQSWSVPSTGDRECLEHQGQVQARLDRAEVSLPRALDGLSVPPNPHQSDFVIIDLP